MPRLLLICLIVLGANLLAAQPPTTASPKSEATKPPAGALSDDPAIVAAAIRNSYYHPDEMSSLDCTISVDWSAFFSALKLNPTPDRLKTIQNMKIRSQAARDKKPLITFGWTDEPLDTHEQLEDGLKQMLEGFYQTYWSIVASSPIGNASDLSKIERLPDGGVEVHSASKNADLVITTDKERTPTHFVVNSPAMNATMDLHFVSSSKPLPGDLRRISSMDVTDQIGNSTINVKLSLDYQAVDGFYVPRHVSYDLVGAYSLSMDFSGCSASKGATPQSKNGPLP